jgi:hypothetical protein
VLFFWLRYKYYSKFHYIGEYGTMANSNFVVHNGLTVGPLSVDAATGDMIATHILPKDTLTYNLGSPTKQWHSAYIGPGSLYVNGQKVLQDESGTIVLSADLDQNLSVQTKGSGDIIFDPTGTGVISLRGPVQMQVGSNFVSSDGNAISFTNAIAVDAIGGKTNNTDLTLSAQGTGQVKVDDTLTVTGDLIIQGTTTNLSVTNFTVQDNIIDLAGETSGNPTANAGIRIVRGDEPAVQLRWNETSDKWQFTNDGTTYQDIQSANSSGDVAVSGTLSVTGATTAAAISATNVTASGTVAAGLFTGPLTGAVTGNTAGTHTGAVVGNVTGNVTGTAATVTGATQSAITAVGTLTALAVTGAVTAGSFTAGNVSVGATADAITSTGTLTLDPNPVGTGGLVVIQGNLQVTGTTTTINSATLDVTDLNITVAKGAANAAAANGAGLTVDGASASMLYTSTTDTFNFNKGVVANLTGNTAGTHTGAVVGNVTGNASGSALTVTQAAQTAITSVGTLTALGVTGTVTAGAFSGPLTGNASTATALQTARAINGVSFDGTAAITVTAAAGTLSGATLASGVTASSLTSVGTLAGVTVSSTIAASANNTINIGAVGTTFATVYATTFSGVSTTAKYADLAENYVGDAAIEPGTVVCFGGENEVTTCDADACSSVAGVVSSNPAYLMNSELAAEFVVAVAFTGRVPCKVTGTVAKGDLMVAAGNGRARAEANPKVGTVIGKALQASEGDAVIEVVVGR